MSAGTADRWPGQGKHQIHVAGPLCERGLKISRCLSEFAALELRIAQSIERLHFLEMRNRLICIPGRKQGKPQQLMRSGQIGIQFEGAFQRPNRAPIIARLHQRSPQPHESRGLVRRCLRCLAELSHSLGSPALIQRVGADFQVIGSFGRDVLPREEQNDR
jgi:hypothetical protein